MDNDRVQKAQEESQLREQLAQIEVAVKQHMSKEALARFGNVRVANPEKAIQTLLVLGQALQAKQITHVDDQTLKQVLMGLTPQKKGMNITRR